MKQYDPGTKTDRGKAALVTVISSGFISMIRWAHELQELKQSMLLVYPHVVVIGNDYGTSDDLT